MRDNWGKLTELLDATIELYTAILALSKAKREALVEVKTQKLESITQQEELLIIKVGKLEVAREKIMVEIAQENGLELEVLTLSKLEDLAENGQAEQLAKLAGDFDRIMTELVPLNRLNTELIEQALGFINFNINVLAQSTALSTYAPQGQNQNGTEVRKLIDQRI
ncbi:MAG: FlgN protein [Firmicutes bacterium]|nr:FlgN protein [Bacillota bacterium]